MRILHTSDLHLGKRIHETPLGDDQRHMLDEIVRIASEERPDALVIAGDVFDRAVPSEEAVTMFGDFLDRVSGIVPGRGADKRNVGMMMTRLGGESAHE